MATAAPTQCPEDAVNRQECPVCMERYRDPRVLQCAHHFCKVCLEEIADRHPQGSVTCPTCRHVTPIEGDTGVSSLAIYRVVNDFIGNVNAAITPNPNATLGTKYCDVCNDKGTRATRVCFGCILCLCDSCNNSKHTNLYNCLEHKTFPITSHIFCDRHENSFNLVFCKTCKEMCCPLSAMEEHTDHECGPMATETTTMREDLQVVINKINNDTEEKLNSDKVHYLLEKVKKTQSDFKEAIGNIKTSIKQLEAKVVKMEEEIITHLTAEIKHLDMMSCDLRDYKDSKEVLEKHLIYLAEEASNQELFVRQRELPKYDPDFFKQLICKPEIELPVLGNTLSDVTAQLNKFHKELNLNYHSHVVNNHSKVGSPLKNLKTETNFNAGKNIYGLAVDSVRERLVVRRSDTTAPITVYDFQGQQLQVLGKDVDGIAGGGQGIAIDTKRDLYILPMADGSLVTMDMNGIVIDEIKLLKTTLNGAAYCETEFYVTSSIFPHKIYLIDPNTKQKVASFSPNTTFNYTRYVHSCQFTSGGVTKPVIVVSDKNDHCIKVFNISGHLLHTYGKAGRGDGELKSPYGVCIDPGGRIIVCDSDNNRVASFWSEGDKDKWEILLGKDKLPGGYHPNVACDPVTRRLFVADNTNIHVFQGCNLT